jgi:elongation factor Ts
MSNPMTVEDLKAIRMATGDGMFYCKRAFEQTGSVEAAIQKLREEAAQRPQVRAANAGVVHTYTHQNRIGVMLEMRCETDFVANTDEFKELVREAAIHIAAVEVDGIGQDIQDMPFVKDETMTLRERIRHLSVKTQENIYLRNIHRLEFGG